MTLDLDDLERRAKAGIASGGHVCFHDSATALAMIERIREMESSNETLRDEAVDLRHKIDTLRDEVNELEATVQSLEIHLEHDRIKESQDGR